MKSDMDIREEFRQELRQEAESLLRSNDFFAIKRKCSELFNQWPLHYCFVSYLYDNCSADQVDAVDLVTKDVPTSCPQVFVKWLLGYKKKMYERHGYFDRIEAIAEEVNSMPLEKPNPWLQIST